MQNLQSCVCCYQSFLECKTFNLVCVLPPELPRMQNLQPCVCVAARASKDAKPSSSVCVCSIVVQNQKICVLRKTGVNGKKLGSCLQIYNGILLGIFRAIKQRCLCVSLPLIPFSLLFLDQLVINAQSKLLSLLIPRQWHANEHKQICYMCSTRCRNRKECVYIQECTLLWVHSIQGTCLLWLL